MFDCVGLLVLVVLVVIVLFGWVLGLVGVVCVLGWGYLVGLSCFRDFVWYLVFLLI